MIYIYNENLFVLNRIKDFVKKLLGRQNRGPQAVLRSLTDGLREGAQEFCVNRKMLDPIETACVISGATTLKWAIAQKGEGRIKKIIAGPNIVVFPQDEGGVLRNPLVDIVIVPGQWVKDLYCLLAPDLAHKIRIWPAGVKVPKISGQKKDLNFLIYDKTNQNSLCGQVINYLKNHKFSFSVLHYGKFRQEDYFELLERTQYEIYLSQSESQGLAMFEAWARNVPTLVWECGEYRKKGVKVTGQISAPFLSSQAGMSFAGYKDFESKLEVFLKARFMPKQYVEENFTNEICTKKFLDIVYEK